MITQEDAAIGENVKRLRGDRSQEALAKTMRTMGHAWKKQTVYNIETGQRQLKLTEARDLLRILGHDPYRDFALLFQSADDVALRIRAERAVEDVTAIESMCMNLMIDVGDLERVEKSESGKYGEPVLHAVAKALAFVDLEHLAERLTDILKGKRMPRFDKVDLSAGDGGVGEVTSQPSA